MVRSAFTLIELIFALVIMGIVFITLPIILINNNKKIEDTFMQEAIFASSTKLGQILTYKWDENSALNNAVITTSEVLDVTNGANALDRNNTDFRIGHIPQPLHRRMTPASQNRGATAIGMEGGVFDDIDDFDGTVDEEIIDTSSTQGYKKAYRATIEVMYIDDNNFRNGTDYNSDIIDFTFTAVANAPTTNLKMIQISTDQNNTDGWSNEPILVLRSYSANIGETDYYKRRY